ncbi:MAG: outer membrane beta-barrel protein [Bacteroidota bacterium]
MNRMRLSLSPPSIVRSLLFRALKKSGLGGFALLYGTVLMGQANIYGKVVGTDETQLAFANVLLLNEADSSLVKGEMSSEEGTYRFEQVPIGKYRVAVSYLGYQTTYSEVVAIRASDDFQVNLTAGNVGANLEEVQVVGRKALFERQIDRVVVNVQNSITMAGASAMEVLQRSPGVSVDEQSGTISLGGRQGVLIMVNGRPNNTPPEALVDLLSNMNASNIEKIEVFSTPPAQFDAEGAGGVINIILKRQEGDGLNGSYSLNAGYGRRFKSGASFNFNYRKDRLNIYGNYSPGYRMSNVIYDFERDVKQMGNTINTQTNNNDDNTTLSNRGRLGLDYYWSDKTVVGLLFSAYVNDREIELDNEAIFSKQQIQTGRVQLGMNGEDVWKHWMTNFNLSHTFQKDRVLSFNLDYLNYDNNNPSTYQNRFFNAEQSLSREQDLRVNKGSPIDIGVFKIDYRHALGENNQISFGLKGTSSQFSNLVLVDTLANGIWSPYEQFSQQYQLEENIGAIYTSFSIQLSAQTKMILGLRYELTKSTFESPELSDPIQRDFGYFFPSLFLSHRLNEEQNFQFSFSRRITRPTFNELAPFVTFVDPTTYFSGNPNLQPSISNALKTEYQYKVFNFSLLYSYDENVIVRYQPVIEPGSNILVNTTENLDRRHLLSFALDFPIQINKWWEMQQSFSALWQQSTIDRAEQRAQVTERSIWMRSIQRFQLPKKWALELSGNYRTPSYYGIFRIAPKGSFDIGIQKRWKNGNLRLNLSDLFVTNIWRSNTDIPELGLLNSLVFNVETRVVRLTFSQNFGSKKVKRSRRRPAGSSAEQRRVY